MRFILTAVVCLAATSVVAQTSEPAGGPLPSPTATAQTGPDPNVVVLRSAPAYAWWEAAEFSRPVSLVLNSSDLDGSIAALAKATGLNLIAAGGSQARKKVTLNLKNAPLRDVMLAFANLYKLEWFQQGSVYVLTYVSAKDKNAKFLPMSKFPKAKLLPLTPTPGDVILGPGGPTIANRKPKTYNPRGYRPKTYIYKPAKPEAPARPSPRS